MASRTNSSPLGSYYNKQFDTTNVYKRNKRNFVWTVVDSAKAEQLTDEELMTISYPMVQKFSTKKRFRRNVYSVLTLHGALINWFYLFQARIIASLLIVFGIVVANTIVMNGHRWFMLMTETVYQAEMDLEYLILMTFLIIFLMFIVFAIPKCLHVTFSGTYSNRIKRVQFHNLMQRMVRFDPYADLHELDYNSDIDPIGGYLWFRELPLATGLMWDALEDFIANDSYKTYQGDMYDRHTCECDCLLTYSQITTEEKIGDLMVFEGEIQCIQKLKCVEKVTLALKDEFEYTLSADRERVNKDEHELHRNLCELSLEAYNIVMKKKEAECCGRFRSLCQKLSFQPPLES